MYAPEHAEAEASDYHQICRSHLPGGSHSLEDVGINVLGPYLISCS